MSTREGCVISSAEESTKPKQKEVPRVIPKALKSKLSEGSK
jgi:hypothetical protein